MAISGSFSTMAATRQPMAAKPKPNDRHGQKTQPDNDWSPPPSGNGQGAPWAEGVTPGMTGRGIMLDLGHRWGHGGTAAVRAASRPFAASRLLGRRMDAPAVEQATAQAASAAAHGDSTAGYYQGHQYDPQPQQMAGSSYEVLRQNVGAIPSMSAQQIAHDRPGGQHLAGQGGQFAPTGFPIGEAGRWARANYSSPTLGAMYSKNTLRGVLPQMVSTPYNQPALTGAAGQNSGIPSNARFLSPRFTMPQLFRSPPSESERLMATSAAAAGGSTVGIGF